MIFVLIDELQTEGFVIDPTDELFQSPLGTDCLFENVFSENLNGNIMHTLDVIVNPGSVGVYDFGGSVGRVQRGNPKAVREIKGKDPVLELDSVGKAIVQR